MCVETIETTRKRQGSRVGVKRPRNSEMVKAIRYSPTLQVIGDDPSEINNSDWHKNQEYYQLYQMTPYW